ncbi:hypothetical protein GH714_026825 [Hevea brasiliensis]|uniref:Gnk2-homologous domain-containing protein n=1 Tax=Hevea brasiliensis TaxID=3981 RepID=A0A6A6L391_HEVBR|nr:hypothetical protein GH714_026825 [Hevea brasiliensis]
MESLVSQSSQKSFSTTTSGDGQNAIVGLYQCRGDLTTPQCYTCVSKIPDMVKKLCGQVIAARVQLNGCYLKYEISGFKQVSETELLFKVCGSTQATGTGFEGMRTAAFDSMVNGLKNGFYTGNNQTVFVLGQCEVSGQAYLLKCFISYSYYPNGVPTIDSGSEVVGTKQHTSRTVAIAVGGIAAFLFLIVCLMFIRSLFKKRRAGLRGGFAAGSRARSTAARGPSQR